MKWFREIRVVGFQDWFWFVCILRRNEFSGRLDAYRYIGKPRENIFRDRERAHRIDVTLSDIH